MLIFFAENTVTLTPRGNATRLMWLFPLQHPTRVTRWVKKLPKNVAKPFLSKSMQYILSLRERIA
jgi:hypothetical protein